MPRRSRPTYRQAQLMRLVSNWQYDTYQQARDPGGDDPDAITRRRERAARLSNYRTIVEKVLANVTFKTGFDIDPYLVEAGVPVKRS